MDYTTLPALDHPLATLREMRLEDIEPWYRIFKQPVVYQHTSWNLSAAKELQHYLETPRTPSR